MSNFQVPVREYMTSDLVTVPASTTLEDAHRIMMDRGISSLPVREGSRVTGVISRTDLLRAGKREAGAGPGTGALILPARSVADEMTRELRTVAPDTSLEEAAKIMTKGFFHRVFIEENTEVIGVLTTRDLMRALEEKRTNYRVGEYMSTPVFTIRDEETLGEAVDRLERGHVSGIVVIEEGWPVGIFGQTEALDARELPRSVAVGDVMNPKILVLPSTTSLHRAAAQARALDVHRVVIHDGERVLGILSGLDFARAVA